jgi:SAM-dependent methyltransferase
MTSAPFEQHWGSEAIDLSARDLPALKARYLIDGLPERGRVLELGSGEGKMLKTVRRSRPSLELLGCDVRTPAVAIEGYEFRLMQGPIPEADGALEAVLVADVLEHVADPAFALGEIRRVLKPGGVLVAFVPVEGERWSAYEFYRRLLGPDLYRRTKEHVQAYTFAGLSALVHERFSVVDWRYAYHALGQLMDASFFAAASLKRLERFWWTENRYYNPDQSSASALTRLLNRALELGNRLAHAESSLLALRRFGAAGVLFTAKKA